MKRQVSKFDRISEYIRDGIISGEFAVGQRLPSDSTLVRMFSSSRPTVTKAMQDLEKKGYLERRTGSGSFVRVRSKALPSLVGILVPEIGNAELFEPVCNEIEVHCNKNNLGLLRTSWSGFDVDDDERERQAYELCSNFIKMKVKGVFFAPIEFSEHMKQVNREIAERLHAAGIAIVLLDRDLERLPDRSPYDLVGVDNFRVGMMQTNYLVAQGEKRIAYVSRISSVGTIDLRISGYRSALEQSKIPMDERSVIFVAPESAEAIEKIKEFEPTAIVCSNDATALMLMNNMQRAGIRVPQDIKLIGVDDVGIAPNALVPLTTIHQPFRQIGAVAAETMVRRIEHPQRAACTVSLSVSVVVRESCGESVEDKHAKP